MAVFTHLETDTGTNADISAATAVGAYTANADKLVMCDVSIDAVAGNGDYVMYVTRQIGGAGSAYRILPQTTMAAASGLTAISGQSGWITVRNGDVLTVYVDGLAGDTTTPDWTTRWFEDSGTAGVAVASIATDAITAAALKADAVTKLQANLALEATLTAIKGAGWTTETLAALKAYVDEIESRLTATRAGYLDKLNVSGNLAHSDAANTYKADVSGLAIANEYAADFTQVVELLYSIMGGEGWTDENLATIQAAIEAIKSKTDNLTFTVANKVDATATVDPTGIATSAELEAVDDKVDEILSKLNSDPLPKIGVGITGSTINAIRGDDFIEALTGVDVLEGSTCQFAIKTRRSDGDNQSLLLADSKTGLIKAKNMSNATSDMAAVTIVGGVYQLEIKAILSRSIPSGSLVWGAQIISAEGQVLEKWGGVWNQIEDTIKAVS